MSDNNKESQGCVVELIDVLFRFIAILVIIYIASHFIIKYW